MMVLGQKCEQFRNGFENLKLVCKNSEYHISLGEMMEAATQPPETVVETNKLNIGAAIILFVLFALSALAIFIR
jgi:hypothetical protein